MQAASITQQILTQEGLVVTYRSVMPDESTSYDYVLLNLAANQDYQFDTVSGWAIGAKKIAQNVIIGTPSTELALGEQLMKEVDVQCITNPLSRKKLLQTLVSSQAPTLIAPAIETHSEEKLPLTVMAVDDNPANLKLITALLKERVETVISCTSGQQAIDKATETQFDIIFMDIQMPKMDGVTACQNIKKLANNANTPVIAVTAHAMTGERDRLLEAGMDDYLTKPIEEHVLQQVLIHWSPTSEVEHIEKINPDHPAISAEVDNSQGSESNVSVHKNIIIDWQAAMKQAANKEDLARDMLQMLVDFIPEVYGAAEKAIEDTDYPVDQLIHIIHKMHGSSSYSGVPRLKSVCATIEKEPRAGTSIEDIEPELFELQDELDKVQATAIHYLKPTSD